MTGARRRPPDDAVLWGAVADTMTLVSAVFLIVFLAALLSYRSEVAAKDEVERRYTAMFQSVQSARQRAIATLTESAGSDLGVLPDGTLQLPELLLFSTGSAELSDRGADFVRTWLAVRIAKVVGDPTQRVLIAGHTDARPITRYLVHKFPSNWELSALRATIVLRAVLQARPDIPAGRVYAAGFADTLPFPDIDANDGRNRRVEVHLTSEGTGIPDQ